MIHARIHTWIGGYIIVCPCHFVAHIYCFCACTFSNLDGFLCNAMIQLHPPRVPDTLKHVGQTESFSNEYPSQVYAFNWCLNGDGMTPLRKSAFCITKPLDLKIAGLPVPITNPLKVRGTHTVKNYFWCWR